MANEETKVTVTLQVNIVVDVSNSGYLGTNETVEKHIQLAKQNAQAWQFLIKEGSLDPKPVQAKVKVLGVSIIPEGV